MIRKGPTVKDIVDAAIDQCSSVFNLRDSIEESRNRAEQATDEKQKRIHAQKGIYYTYVRGSLTRWTMQGFKIFDATSS